MDSSWSMLEEKVDGPHLMILLETTAGQGTNIGHRFEHLADIRERTSISERVGVCLDTCHIHAAGYNISTPADYGSTMDEFNTALSLDSLKAIHINDSKKDHGSKVDRHANIGEGTIGPGGFELIMNDDRLKNVPAILETPGGDEEYIRNLGLLRFLVSG